MSINNQFGPKAVAAYEPLSLRDVPPSLLNSADIAAYAERLTPRLFEPFNPDALKPATYEIPFEGDVFRWTDEGKPLEKIELNRDGMFTIEPNSIIFISPATYFRVPLFLALRFNLHIKLVHRGLLLGTGPLVDPGFAGRLLIPVHNLTSQPFVIRGSDGFIWIEVTKLSPVRYGYSQIPFVEKKKARSSEDYLSSANSLNPIVSTLHVTSKKIESLWNRFRFISFVGIISAALAVAALVYTALSLVRDTHQYVVDTRKSSEDELSKIRDENEKIRKEINFLQSELATIRQLQKGVSSGGPAERSNKNR